MVEVSGNYSFNSRILGRVDVPGINFKSCNQCGESVISLDESKKVTSYVKQMEQKAIERLPFDQFITMGEAADILGYTKQAFSKNPRIKRGLIMSGKKDRRKYYLRKSVSLYKEKNNGIFPMPGIVEVYDTVKNIVSSTEIRNTGSVGRFTSEIDKVTGQWKRTLLIKTDSLIEC
ncbi:MAG: hypothetical protein HQ517_10770 [SAR324 cluster bacterium]|nr:hypothetical protein [SAR324 cluster bacterium]